MDYRRSQVCGGTFFFTVVTHIRQKMLVTSNARDFLRRAFRDVGARHPFALEAVVLLPDHLHMLMRLPPDEADFSIRVGGVKRRFTDLWLSEGCAESPISDGKKAKRYRGVWQGRFWEHTIRDAADFKRHMDYIHVNPVKHG
ncbi:MAG: transposase, partial [Phycisphaerae bacterium]|nr:transposase [Phycisphaerae bacterium]